jgi:hypothetical protein
LGTGAAVTAVTAVTAVVRQCVCPGPPLGACAVHVGLGVDEPEAGSLSYHLDAAEKTVSLSLEYLPLLHGEVAIGTKGPQMELQPLVDNCLDLAEFCGGEIR